jgi:bifunctional DNase/RNase
MDQVLHPLLVEGIIQHNENDSPHLLLRDNRSHPLEIAVGLCEAKAVQMGLDDEVALRPMTHDLILVLAGQLDAQITRVVIDDVSGGTYFARLTLTTPSEIIHLDCRPSDGIALAIRARAPILATEAVIEHTGAH